MHRYKVTKQRNALDKDKKEMYYPRLTMRSKYDLYDLKEDNSQRSSFSQEYHHHKRLLERNTPEY